jgi:AcrR family transcriptional regulator
VDHPTSQQRRRRPASLSRDEIVRAAIAVADNEGSDAIRMRRIAHELGTGTMSIYWHVRDKRHLLDLMVDAVRGEGEIGEPTGDWRHDLAHIARQQRQSLLRHRWALDLLASHRPLGPNTLRHLEHSLAALDNLQLDTRTALRVLTTVDAYVTGFTLDEIHTLRSQQTQDASGLGPAETESTIKAWQATLATSGRLDRVLRIFTDALHPGPSDTNDARFEFGLTCLLDGLSTQLPDTGLASSSTAIPPPTFTRLTH